MHPYFLWAMNSGVCKMFWITILFGSVGIAFGEIPQALIRHNPYGNHEDSVASRGQAFLKKPAVRPFITDDARVVGGRLAQLETWLRFDKESGQHWLLAAYGPTDKLEISLGGLYGYWLEPHTLGSYKHLFSYALPLVQVKYLFREYIPNKPPGVALVLGTFFPLGRGFFVPPGYGSYTFAVVTQSFGKNDLVLFHLNLGANYYKARNSSSHHFIPTWGLGNQTRAYKGFHLVGEFFSGDPYVPGTGLSFQVGFRHFFSDLIQIDGTVGKGIGGRTVLPLWFSGGVRLVAEWFLKKNKA